MQYVKQRIIQLRYGADAQSRSESSQTDKIIHCACPGFIRRIWWFLILLEWLSRKSDVKPCNIITFEKPSLKFFLFWKFTRVV